MNTGPRDKIRCTDGTEVAFQWVDDEAPQFEWLRDRSHWPEPLTRLELWMLTKGLPGADRAWDEIQMIAPPMFRRFLYVGPYFYTRMSMPTPEEIARIVPRVVEVSQEFGGALAFWKQYCEPRIMRTCEKLDAMDHTADMVAAAELQSYGFHQTFTSLSPLFIPAMQLTMMLTGLMEPPDIELTIHEVTQGGDNATQEVDFEIWELAELARATPAVAVILGSELEAYLPALRAEPAAAAFLAAFDALIARHGSRAQGWTLLDETWRERPELALALVRAGLSAESTSPDEQRARSAARRQAATERVLAMLPPERHEEFHGAVRALDGYVKVREGRAYWQLVCFGVMRGLVLRIGAELVRAGRIDRAEDALFITPDDYGRDDLRAVVAEARAEWEDARTHEPPLIIGKAGEIMQEVEARRAEFRGAPASRGVVTGTARVIHSPEDGARLGQGEILVCVMTSPAWTPLFAIAGGIVTETGGALSHPAITAREYCIPAVVALEGATTRIADGQTITVDGSTGTVSLVAEAARV